MKAIFYLEKSIEAVKSILFDIQRSLPYWIPILLVSFSWYCAAAMGYLINSVGYYSPAKLLEWWLVIPFIFLVLSWAAGRFVIPCMQDIRRQNLKRASLSIVVIVVLVILVFPVPLPALPQIHSLKIIATGEKNEASGRSDIEIVKLHQFDGNFISLDQLKASGNWRISSDNRYLYKGNQEAILELSGVVSGGLALTVQNGKTNGKATIIWDGVSKEYDFYAEHDFTSDLVLGQESWLNLEPLQLLICGALLLLYFLGFSSFALLTVSIVTWLLQQTRYTKLSRFILVGWCLLIFIFFLKTKTSYLDLDMPKFHNDTNGYALTAEKSLLSSDFWAGQRAFTLPLVFKLLRIDTINYRADYVGARLVIFQVLLSIGCWSFLGLVAGYVCRKRWLAPWALGAILLFSVNLEISMWDSVLLAESISFSLFALLVGLWILMISIDPMLFRSRVGKFIFVGMIVVTIVFNFSRDTNIFFLMICSAVFFIAACLKESLKIYRWYFLSYAIFVALLFGVQNATTNYANRWQVHIYDHLALRILKDEQATKYFENAGLPVSDRLMRVVDMKPPSKYEIFLATAPEMEPVRQWVNDSGKATLLTYILSRPLDSLIEPMMLSNQMINGSNLEYRQNKYLGQPYPWALTWLSGIFYPRSPIILLAMVVLGVVGSVFYLTRKQENPAWLVVLVLLLSIYPLMFVVWHGNPMEIERHAAPIGVLLRLAGWMALLFMLPKELHA